MKRSLLIAEDDENLLDLLGTVFSRPDILLRTARTGDEAIALLGQVDTDVVLTDLVMPGRDGLEVLKYALRNGPDCEVILMTGHGTVENAVQAMKLGAFHYITKPFRTEEVVHLVERASELARMRKENLRLRNQAIDRYGFENLVGVSDPIREVFSLVSKVASSDSTVLILGESGTGKELIARAIHFNSRRANRPLVPVNCSAIPPDLLESELFGHVRGAFTGAHTTKPGLFETAHRGTIFLDEIAEMGPHLQAKILRVLQEQSFTPVGGTRTVQIDVRVLAATNRDLEREIEQGRFRQDLFFRLNVIPVRLPPLRDRVEDIPLLADHFVRIYSAESGRTVQGFSPEAMEILRRYRWPGNVRELENLVERLVLLTRTGWFAPDDLPGKMRREQDVVEPEEIDLRSGPIDFRRERESFEDRLIRKALRIAGGNRNRAAELLGLKRTTFLEMLKRKGLDRR